MDGGRLYYHFHSREKTIDRELISKRCTHIKANNQQCKLNVVIGLDKCHHHKKSDMNLQIKTSNIIRAGKGLFAFDKDNEIVFKNNDIICAYDGEIITNAELNRRYGETDTANYTVKINKGKNIDSSVYRSVGSIVNHSSAKSKINAKFALNPRTNTVLIRATKNIKHGAEIYLNYGDEYNFNDRGVCSSTNNNKYKC